MNPFLCLVIPYYTMTDLENSLLPVTLEAAIPNFSTKFVLLNESQTRRGFKVVELWGLLCFKDELQG